MLDWNNLDVDSITQALDEFKQRHGYIHAGLFTQHPLATVRGYFFDSGMDEKAYQVFYKIPYCFSTSIWKWRKRKRVEEKTKAMESRQIKIPLMELPQELQLKDPCNRPCPVVAIV